MAGAKINLNLCWQNFEELSASKLPLMTVTYADWDTANLDQHMAFADQTPCAKRNVKRFRDSQTFEDNLTCGDQLDD